MSCFYSTINHLYPIDKMARKMVQINAMKIDYIKLKLTAAYQPVSQSFNRCRTWIIMNRLDHLDISCCDMSNIFGKAVWNFHFPNQLLARFNSL